MVIQNKQLLSRENPFALFRGHSKAGEAEQAIMALIDNFISDLENLQEHYRKAGADDTASREAIAMYIAKEKLRLVRIA